MYENETFFDCSLFHALTSGALSPSLLEVFMSDFHHFDHEKEVNYTDEVMMNSTLDNETLSNHRKRTNHQLPPDSTTLIHSQDRKRKFIDYPQTALQKNIITNQRELSSAPPPPLPLPSSSSSSSPSSSVDIQQNNREVEYQFIVENKNSFSYVKGEEGVKKKQTKGVERRKCKNESCDNMVTKRKFCFKCQKRKERGVSMQLTKRTPKKSSNANQPPPPPPPSSQPSSSSPSTPSNNNNNYVDTHNNKVEVHSAAHLLTHNNIKMNDPNNNPLDPQSFLIHHSSLLKNGAVNSLMNGIYHAHNNINMNNNINNGGGVGMNYINGADHPHANLSDEKHDISDHFFDIHFFDDEKLQARIKEEIRNDVEITKLSKLHHFLLNLTGGSEDELISLIRQYTEINLPNHSHSLFPFSQSSCNNNNNNNININNNAQSHLLSNHPLNHNNNMNKFNNSNNNNGYANNMGGGNQVMNENGQGITMAPIPIRIPIPIPAVIPHQANSSSPLPTSSPNNNNINSNNTTNNTSNNNNNNTNNDFASETTLASSSNNNININNNISNNNQNSGEGGHYQQGIMVNYPSEYQTTNQMILQVQQGGGGAVTGVNSSSSQPSPATFDQNQFMAQYQTAMGFPPIPSEYLPNSFFQPAQSSTPISSSSPSPSPSTTTATSSSPYYPMTGPVYTISPSIMLYPQIKFPPGEFSHHHHQLMYQNNNSPAPPSPAPSPLPNNFAMFNPSLFSQFSQFVNPFQHPYAHFPSPSPFPNPQITLLPSSSDSSSQLSSTPSSSQQTSTSVPLSSTSSQTPPPPSTQNITPSTNINLNNSNNNSTTVIGNAVGAQTSPNSPLSPST